MEKILLVTLYDTETSGLVKKGSYDSPGQPYCLQLGAMVYNTNTGAILQKMAILVNWKGIEIDKGASDITGITKDVMALGLNPKNMLRLFYEMVTYSQLCIGFNVGFDRTVMQSSLCKIGARDCAKALGSVRHMDIMKPLTDVCKLPGRYGYKWPKLTEAYEMLIDPKGFNGAHDALADIQATFDLWTWCQENGVLLEEV